MNDASTATELKRDLGPWAAASIVVGTVIGSGIFLVPKTMIQRAGSPHMVFVAWVVGGLLSTLLLTLLVLPSLYCLTAPKGEHETSR